MLQLGKKCFPSIRECARLPRPFFLQVAWRPLQFGLFCTLWLVFASFLSMVPFPSSCSVTLLLVILSGLLLWGWFLFRFFRFSLVSFIVFGSPVAWIYAYSAVFSVFNRSFNRIGMRSFSANLIKLSKVIKLLHSEIAVHCWRENI